MNIGILTFHCADNYGAVLQAYGLQSVLRNLGHNVSIIDYRPQFIVGNYKVLNNPGLSHFNQFFSKKYLKHLLTLPIRNKRINNFNSFRKHHLNLSSIETIDENSIMIVGSDQIWNPKLTGGKLDEYYLLENFNGNKIAYAASAGDNEVVKSSFDHKTVSHLKSFSAISTREKFLKEILEEKGIAGIETVVDPVILAGAEAFEPLIDERYKPNEPYILSFSLVYSKEYAETSEKIGRDRNKKVIHLSSADSSFFSQGIINTASISQFLTLIKYADEVVTYSFHGISFATLFNKQFWYLDIWDKRSARILNYLSQIGLEDRYIDGSTLPVIKPIDYTAANEKIDAMRRKSRHFITSAIDKIANKKS